MSIEAKAPNIGDSAYTRDKIFNTNAEIINGNTNLSNLKFSEFDTRPLFLPNAWTTGESYGRGDTVVSDGSVYMTNSVGVSGVTAPTGKGYDAIVDGGCEWYYMRNATTKDTLEKPAVTFGGRLSIATDLTNKHHSVDNISEFAFSGGVPTSVNVGSQTAIRLPSTNSSPSNGNCIGTYSSNNGRASFMSDAIKIAINGENTTGWNQRWILFVDGNRVEYGGLGDTSNTSRGTILVDWTGQERKLHRYDFFYAGSDYFYGVWTDSFDSVYAPPTTSVIACVGDSLTQGSNEAPAMASYDWCTIVNQKIGLDFAVWNLGSGGTGFINNQSNTKMTYLQRIQDVVDSNPSYIVIAGNHNDMDQTEEAQKNAVVAYLDALSTLLPNVPVLLCPPLAGASTSVAWLQRSENAMETAVSETTNKNVTFFKLATGGVSWFFGTGYEGTPKQDGNCDIYTSVDRVHPKQLGINYLGEMYCDKITSWVKGVV